MFLLTTPIDGLSTDLAASRVVMSDFVNKALATDLEFVGSPPSSKKGLQALTFDACTMSGQCPMLSGQKLLTFRGL